MKRKLTSNSSCQECNYEMQHNTKYSHSKTISLQDYSPQIQNFPCRTGTKSSSRQRSISISYAPQDSTPGCTTTKKLMGVLTSTAQPWTPKEQYIWYKKIHITVAPGTHISIKDGILAPQLSAITAWYPTFPRQPRSKSSTRRNSSLTKAELPILYQKTWQQMRQWVSPTFYYNQRQQALSHIWATNKLRHCISLWPYST